VVDQALSKWAGSVIQKNVDTCSWPWGCLKDWGIYLLTVVTDSLTYKFVLLLFFCISNWKLFIALCFFSSFSLQINNGGAEGENPEASLNTFSVLLRMETAYASCLRTIAGIPYPLLFWNTSLQVMCLCSLYIFRI